VLKGFRRAHAALGIVHEAPLKEVDEVPVVALKECAHVLDLGTALPIVRMLG
jgi:hypothetical protein